MNYIFSAKSNAFYPVSMQADYVKAGSWPADGVEVTNEDFNLYSGYPPTGKILSSDDKGLPIWVGMPAPTKEQLIAQAQSTKELKISSALQTISFLQLKLQVGRKLTDSESAQVNSVLDYVDALEAVDTNSAPDITWPDGLNL